MPLSEDQKGTLSIMWICVIGSIICIILHSPVAFLFVFGLMFSFFGMLKSFGNIGGTPNFDDVEMRPLEEGRNLGDMTLGELMAKY